MPPGTHKYHKKYTFRDAVGVQFRKEVSAQAAEESQAQPSAPPYLAAYPQALSKFIKGMTEEQTLEVENLVKTWNIEGPSEDQRRK